MKNYLRVGLSAQTANSASGGNNPEKAVADFPICATGYDVGTRNGAGFFAPAPHLEHIHAMFDCERPGRSGGLAGEAFAATLEGHPAYPNLRRRRHRALLARCDDIVANHINSIAGILQGLGFDEAGTKIYRASALRAFRAVLPN